MSESKSGDADEPASDIVITQGSNWTGERRTLAALLYEGYAKKAEALQVSQESALTLLEGALNLDRCFVALGRGSVVGIVGVVEDGGRALQFPWVLMRTHFGALRGSAGYLLLSFRTWTASAPDELLFEALAVAPGARRLGIGARLVNHVEAYARQKGYASVGLEVTDSNRAALHLYDRLGYEVVRTRHFGFLTRRAGFTGNCRMRKRVR